MQEEELVRVKIPGIGNVVERADMHWHRLPIPDGGVPGGRFDSPILGVHPLILLQRGRNEQDVLKFVSDTQRDLIDKM